MLCHSSTIIFICWVFLHIFSLKSLRLWFLILERGDLISLGKCFSCNQENLGFLGKLGGTLLGKLVGFEKGSLVVTFQLILVLQILVFNLK